MNAAEVTGLFLIYSPVSDEDARTEEMEMNSTPRCTWESTLWPEIKEHLSVHLQFGQLLSESVPRTFDYKHRDFLMQRCNLQPAEYKADAVTSSMDLERFGPACDHGYYSVTIVGAYCYTSQKNGLLHSPSNAF